MIAVDTNILVYAHRVDSEWHEPARECITKLTSGYETWGLPWHCLHEFFAIVTNPRVFRPASTYFQAIKQIEVWLGSPVAECLSDTSEHWQILREILTDSRVQGPLVYDARIAAICQAHRVVELWSADRDFGRFPGVRVRNPLIN